MKHLTLLLFAAILAVPFSAGAESPAPTEKPAEKPAETKPAKAGKFKWYTDFKAAKKAAVEEKKPLLMLFTGSDWCPYCIKLEKEVLSSKEFKSWAPNHVILFIADAKGGSKNMAPENKKLMKEYGVGGFPTIVLADTDANKLGTTGYNWAKPADYIKGLEKKLDAKK